MRVVPTEWSPNLARVAPIASLIPCLPVIMAGCLGAQSGSGGPLIIPPDPVFDTPRQMDGMPEEDLTAPPIDNTPLRYMPGFYDNRKWVVYGR